MTDDTGNGHDNDGAVGSGGVNVFSRPAVQIWWDVGSTDADTAVTIRAENAENGDVGIKLDKNDGLTTLTYPAGTKVTDHVTVFETDNPDNVIAEFAISVRVDD